MEINKYYSEQFENLLISKLQQKSSSLQISADSYFISLCKTLDIDNNKKITFKNFKKLLREKLNISLDNAYYDAVLMSLSKNSYNIQKNNVLINYTDYINDILYSKNKIRKTIKENSSKCSLITLNLNRLNNSIKNSVNLIKLYHIFIKCEIKELILHSKISKDIYLDDIKYYNASYFKPSIFNYLFGEVSVDNFVKCIYQCKLNMSIQEIQQIYHVYDEKLQGKFNYITLFADLTVSKLYYIMF